MKLEKKVVITSLIAGALLVAAVLALIWSRPPAPQLTRWGLPADLLDSHITELALPPGVDRADWLPPALRRLDISHTQVRDLSHLPRELEELDASYTAVDDISNLPRTLRALDLTASEVTDAQQLPAGLIQLKLGSTLIHHINNLPPFLRILEIDDAILADLRALPSTLRALKLKGIDIENLERIPESLQSLTLEGTRVKSIKGLPSTLESLELKGNAQLTLADDLPSHLIRLVIDQRSLPDLGSLKSLIELDDVFATPQSVSLFPRPLATLQLRSLPPDIGRLPGLRTIALVGGTASSLKQRDLPRDLESLTLESFSDSVFRYEGPAALRELRLPFSNVADVEALPRGLFRLDLSGTRLRQLPALPPALRELRLRWSNVLVLPSPLPRDLKVLDVRHSPGIATLPALPAGLEELLVGGTHITSLPSLPLSLRRLDLSSTEIRDLHSAAIIPGGLPPALEELCLSPDHVTFLGKLPPKLKRLSFVDRE